MDSETGASRLFMFADILVISLLLKESLYLYTPKSPRLTIIQIVLQRHLWTTL